MMGGNKGSGEGGGVRGEGWGKHPKSASSFHRPTSVPTQTHKSESLVRASTHSLSSSARFRNLRRHADTRPAFHSFLVQTGWS